MLTKSSRVQEVLLLPNGKALKALTFDYKNLFSNILWFNTISYFGKHYKGDKSYVWLKHMCNLVSDLDPKASYVYEFCGLMLAWEANDAKGAITTLSQGIKALPDYWRFYYLRGIYEIIFLQDTAAAKADLAKGASLPEAPAFLTKLATRAVTQLEGPSTAIAFLKGMIARSKDPSEKKSLRRHLNIILYSLKFDDLEKAVADFKIKNKRAPINLVEVVGSQKLIQDPFGGKFYLDPQTGKIKSTSKIKKKNLFSRKLAKEDQ